MEKENEKGSGIVRKKRTIWRSAGWTVAAVLLLVNVWAESPEEKEQQPRGYIALTFDDGPHSKYTAEILDLLKEYHVHATFFVVGNFISDNPDLIRRMVSEGHTVGNHTMTHPDMSGISSKDDFQKQLDGVEKLYESVTGEQMTKFYRPPQGIYSTSNLAMAQELGYSTFFWSLAYVDWIQNQQPSREEAFQKLLGRIHPGAIVLLHNTSSTNGLILDDLLTKWEEMGYRFCSLKELTGA